MSNPAAEPAKEGMSIVQTLAVPGAGALFGYLIADMNILEERIYAGMVSRFTADQLKADNEAKLKQIILLSSLIPAIIYAVIAFSGLAYALTDERKGKLSGYAAGFIGGAGAGAVVNKVGDMLSARL